MARYDDRWPAYVPVAERRRQAERETAKLRKTGHLVAPVQIEGRAIATTVWGKAWCDNLESYRDYESRLPRGRTYVRNGSVIDLQIGPCEVKALVSGSSIYKVGITIAPVPAAQWRSICADCAGRVESLVELLQGRLSQGVMERICRQGTGLFPKPSDIRFSCSCLDYASMCKHVAAVLYGVGARLDRSPELLFRMRAVDESELLASLDSVVPAATLPGERVLAGEDVAALFGLDMAGSDDEEAKTSDRLSQSPPVSDAAVSSPPKQAAGRSRPKSPKKVASAAPSSPAKGAQPRIPTLTFGRGNTTVGKSVATRRSKPGTLDNTENKSRKAAALGLSGQPQSDTRPARSSSVRVCMGQAKPAGQAAKGAPLPGRVTPLRQRSTSRSGITQAAPAPAELNEQSARQVLEAVLAQLESLGRGIGDVGQLRADVQKPGGRIDELATIMAGQGAAPPEGAASAMSERSPKPKRTSPKQREARARRSAELGGTSDRSSAGKGNVNGGGRDPVDAVPLAAAVQTQAPLKPKDEVALDAPKKQPRRAARSAGKAARHARN